MTLLQVLIYSPTFFKYAFESWLGGHGRYPSTGFLTLMLAIHICDEVSKSALLPKVQCWSWQWSGIRFPIFKRKVKNLTIGSTYRTKDAHKHLPITFSCFCMFSAFDIASLFNVGQCVWIWRRPIWKLAPLLGGQYLVRCLPTHRSPWRRLRIQCHHAACRKKQNPIF